MDNEKKIEIPFGAFDSELIHQEINIPNGFKATIEGDKIILTRAEREDEKVRKALAEMVHDTTGDSLWVDYNVHKEEALAWLEKQGEEQPIIRWHSINEEPEEMKELFCEWESDDATWHDVAFYDKESHTFRHAKMPINVTKWVYVDELLEEQAEVVSDKDDIEAEEKGIRKAFNKIWEEKQSEQKPVDKVGHTVVRDFNSVFSREQVEEIDKRIKESQRLYNAKLRDAMRKVEDFPMTD